MNRKGSPTYRHEVFATPSSQFRLITILSGTPGSPLELQIISSSFPTSQPYFALSYEWGSEKEVEEVLVNNKPFRIRRNLYSFLRQLSTCSACQVEGSREHLWCDAICIDQSSNSEKSDQVRMMSLIYAKAQAVYVWLGEQADSSEVVFDVIWSFLRQPGAKYPPPIGGEDWKSETEYYTMLVRILKAKVVDPMRILYCLFSRTYWQRLWVAQEIMVSRAVYIFCGDCWLPPEAFPNLQFLASSPEIWKDMFGPPGHLLRDFDHMWLPASWLLFSRVSLSGHPSLRSLPSLIGYFSNGTCSEPRDHVYALVGMASETASGRVFPVDYRCSLPTLFENVTLFCDGLIHLLPMKHLICALGRSHTDGNVDNVQVWLRNFIQNCRSAQALSNVVCSISLEMIGQFKASEYLSMDTNHLDDSDSPSVVLLWRHLHGKRGRAGDMVLGIQDSLLCVVYRSTAGSEFSLVGVAVREPAHSHLDGVHQRYLDAVQQGTLRFAQLGLPLISGLARPSTFQPTPHRLLTTYDDALSMLDIETSYDEAQLTQRRPPGVTHAIQLRQSTARALQRLKEGGALPSNVEFITVSLTKELSR